MRFSPRRDDDDDIHVNVVPFIDVLLVLLIFFLVATSFVQQARLPISLPQASEQAAAPEEEALNISIDRDARVAIGETVLEAPTLETLKQHLSEVLGQQPEERSVMIAADAEARHQSLITVMDALRQLGVRRLGLATSSLEIAPPAGTPTGDAVAAPTPAVERDGGLGEPEQP